MSTNETVAYFFCVDNERDPVARHVLDFLIAEHDPEPTSMVVDGHDVVVARPANGIEMLLVSVDEVVSHDYPRYLPMMNALFGHAAAAVVVNWHEGANAPDRVLTAHSTGDVNAGAWAPSDPCQLRNLLVSLDEERRLEGLDDYSVVIEGTHWSGVPYGCDPSRVGEYAVPLYDVEIGSSPASWSSPAAARVVGRALTHILDEARVKSVLCGGGVHCERAFTDPVIAAPAEHAIAVSHVLPNHWLVSGGYDTAEADAKLDGCVASIVGGVDVVAIHGKLKAAYKDAFRRLGERLAVPVVKHTALTRPEELS